MSVPPMTPHRLAGATRDWKAIGAFIKPAHPDPATGGSVGISIMVGVVVVVAMMLATGGVL